MMKNWLNKYEDGGPTDPVPPKKKQEPTSMTDYINPMNWFVSNLDDAGTFNQAFAKARNEGMDEFMWYGTRYNTDLAETAAKPKVNDLTSQYEKDFPKTWQYAVALTKLPRYNNIKPEQFMNLLERIRNTETKDQNINQIGGGPGQGYYQFEPESLITTRKRNEVLRKELKDIVGIDLPEAAEFKNDFKTLSKDDQSIYGITNLIKAAAAKRQVNPSYQIDFTNPGQAWLDLHWAGAGTHPEDVPVRIKHWNSINPDFQIRSQEIKTTKSSKTANPVKHADGGRTGLTRRYEFYGQYPEYGLGSHVVHGGPAWPRWFDRYEEGGYTVRKTDERAGKTHVVTGPDGTKKYFGDPNMGERGDSKLGKEAFYARHAKNLENNPYFRAYARATWETGGTVTDEYKKVRSTVPRVSYTEPSGIYTGPTTQRGITFADGGPTGKNKKVYTNLNEFNKAKQAEQDSIDLYNRFKDDKNNYINFVKAQGLNPNFVEPIIPSSWVAKAEKINPTIEPVIGGMLTSTGGGFERDSKGNARSFNYYPTMSKTDLKVFDDTELGKTLAAGYIGYPKPVIEPVYQPRPKLEPVQFAPMKDFTFSSTEMQPAANPFPTEMIAPTVDEIMMPSGQRISRKEFIKQYGEPAWNKATNQGNYKKKNGGSTDPEPFVKTGRSAMVDSINQNYTAPVPTKVIVKDLPIIDIVGEKPQDYSHLNTQGIQTLAKETLANADLQKRLEQEQQDTWAKKDKTQVGPEPVFTPTVKGHTPYAVSGMEGALGAADVVSDLMQYGYFVPHPVAWNIGTMGSGLGSVIDSYQAGQQYALGNYDAMAANLASAGLSGLLASKGYTRDMYNTVPGSLADKIASLGSRSGTYRPLTAYPHLRNNPVIRRGLNFNRGSLGALGAETIYDIPKQEAGGMIKRADGSYSRRGLWDNIRANRGSGKKPTKEMLKQERKIRAAEKKETGGYINKTNNNWLDNL